MLNVSSSFGNGQFESQWSDTSAVTLSVTAPDAPCLHSVPPLHHHASSQGVQVSLDMSCSFSKAWLDIREISVDPILQAHPARTVQSIKLVLKSHFIDCCAVALNWIKEDPGNVDAWKLFLLIPRMVLAPQCGGKMGTREANVTYNKFLSGAWKDLIHLDLPPVQRDSVDSEAVRRLAAIKLIRCGELSKTA